MNYKLKNKKRINNQSGAAMLIAVMFFLFISLAIVAGLVSPTVRAFQDSSVNLKSKQSYYLAESGSEDVYYRIKKSMTVGASETLTLDSNSVTTTTTTTGSQKEIVSLGDVSSYERKVNLVVKAGSGIGFNYGIQVGTGGVYLQSGQINGNVYTNGPITATSAGDNWITGTAVSAGPSGSITGDSVNNKLLVGKTSGVAQAHTVNYVNNPNGLIYCQNGTGNNKTCTAQADPPITTFPITDANINDWKNIATIGGVINGNYTVGPWPNQNVTLGSTKIVGNLTVSNGGTLTVNGTIWVTGNVIIGYGHVKLASSYGLNDGVIVSDGTIAIQSGSDATGSSTNGSYLMLLTTSSSASAVSIEGGSGALIAYAANGKVSLTGGAKLKEVVAKSVDVKGGSNVTYESGLIDSSFSSGPSGSWTLDTWKEAQ